MSRCCGHLLRASVNHYFAHPTSMVDMPLEVTLVKSEIDGKTFPPRGTWRRTSGSAGSVTCRGGSKVILLLLGTRPVSSSRPPLFGFSPLLSSVSSPLCPSLLPVVLCRSLYSSLYRMWRTSPDEVVIAYFEAISLALKHKPDEADAWIEGMLCTPCNFFVVQEEGDLEWRSQQHREDASTNVTLARTPVQRIFDICQRRHQLGPKISVEKMVEVYATKLRLSERSEKITRTSIDMAFTVWDRALSRPTIREVVLEQEALRENSVFNGTTKMQAIVSKAALCQKGPPTDFAPLC